MTDDDTAAPLEEDCDFGLNITNEGASSGKISEELGWAALHEVVLDEAMVIVPPRDSVQPGLDWVPGQSSSAKSAKNNDAHRAR